VGEWLGGEGGVGSFPIWQKIYYTIALITVAANCMRTSRADATFDAGTEPIEWVDCGVLVGRKWVDGGWG